MTLISHVGIEINVQSTYICPNFGSKKIYVDLSQEDFESPLDFSNIQVLDSYRAILRTEIWNLLALKTFRVFRSFSYRFSYGCEFSYSSVRSNVARNSKNWRVSCDFRVIELANGSPAWIIISQRQQESYQERCKVPAGSLTAYRGEVVNQNLMTRQKFLDLQISQSREKLTSAHGGFRKIRILISLAALIFLRQDSR